MPGNSFGSAFRITTFGESHGPGVGVIIDGCPPRLPVTVEEIQRELDRRRPGQSAITTQRREADQVEILSGMHEGLTLGTPLAMLVRNQDMRSGDYEEMRTKFRPSHADYTYKAKYGVRAWQGGGRASARETMGRVAAGAVARKVLAGVAPAGAPSTSSPGSSASPTSRRPSTPATVTRDAVDANIARCPEAATAEKMIARIDEARKAGDSLGGVVAAVARGVPAGLGEPVFDKLEADLAKAMLSLPAAKGFEIGSGLRRHAADRQPAQRSVLRRRRARPHPEQPFGRRAGRHLERRGHRHPRRVQADRDHPARAGDRRRGRPRHDHQGRAAATIRACCRARSRSSRRCWRWCSPIISSGSAASAGNAARRRPSRSSSPRRGCKGRAVDLLSLRVDAGMPVVPSPTEEPRQIHFTFTAPDAVTFDWRGSDAALRLWAKNVAPRTVEAHRPEPAPFSSPGPWQEAMVDGLRSGDGIHLRGRSSRAADDADRSARRRRPAAVGFKFVAVGDIGASTAGPPRR